MQKSLISLIPDQYNFWARTQLLLNRALIVYTVQEQAGKFGAPMVSKGRTSFPAPLLHALISEVQPGPEALGQNCR